MFLVSRSYAIFSICILVVGNTPHRKRYIYLPNQTCVW